jgi:hypothetical protein
MTDHSLMILFSALQDQENPPILELLNKDRQPVGAIYLDKFKYKNFVISETNNSEKYYFYVDGLGIYFSYYQKINP